MEGDIEIGRWRRRWMATSSELDLAIDGQFSHPVQLEKGTFATFPTVQKYKEAFNLPLLIDRKVLAIDMEAYHFYHGERSF
jgi:hypothetical protein